MKKITLYVLIGYCSILYGSSFHIEGEYAWLEVNNMPVSEVFQLFEERGAKLYVDPDLVFQPITGKWEQIKIERLLSQLIYPHTYSIQWKLESSPVGALYQISSIRIFDDRVSAAKLISKKKRVLEVLEAEDGSFYVKGEVMVGFKEGSTINDLNALLRQLNGTVIEVINPPGIYRIKLNDTMSIEEALAIIDTHSMVDSSDPNRAFSNEALPEVPISGSHTDIHLGLAPGEQAIAVFDSGLDPAYQGMDFIKGTFDALNGGSDIDDPTGHGTLVSLIASGSITPEGEVSSGKSAPVVSVKLFDENGMTSTDAIMEAFNYAISADVKVINMSFGTYADVGYMEHMVQYAASKGIKVIVASGNDGKDHSMNPAASPATLSIGANDAGGQRASYSNGGANIYASGKVILDGKVHHGTSYASPYIANQYATGSR